MKTHSDMNRELTSCQWSCPEMEGFNVIVAHDGEQALDDSIDLLLLGCNDAVKKMVSTHYTSPDTPDAHYVDGARQ